MCVKEQWRGLSNAVASYIKDGHAEIKNLFGK